MSDDVEARLEAAREEGRRKLAEDATQAAIYCRMSVARFDDTTKVEDQERICRELARQRGWEVDGAYGYDDDDA